MANLVMKMKGRELYTSVTFTMAVNANTREHDHEYEYVLSKPKSLKSTTNQKGCTHPMP
jgi:hypothetical protein